jgi:pSer/pThr/pTyr-binding forkhead associated (FHA) protein
MIQLNILSGKQAGTHQVARHFPFLVGRAKENQLQLEDDGVWDQHLTIEFQPRLGFNLTTAPDAIVRVNGESVQNITLRNGDTISVGSVKLQFWLAAAKQDGLRAHESIVWTLLALVTLVQFVLLYWLVR